VVGVAPAVGGRWFRHAGGMPPFDINKQPSGRYLCFAEREEIALLRAQKKGVREIARSIGRDPGTISRELRRNAATRGGQIEYRASVAQWKADMAARRPKVAKLVANERLCAYVEDRLAGNIRSADSGEVVGPPAPKWSGLNKPRRGDREWVQGWSPEQIAKRIQLDSTWATIKREIHHIHGDWETMTRSQPAPCSSTTSKRSTTRTGTKHASATEHQTRPTRRRSKRHNHTTIRVHENGSTPQRSTPRWSTAVPVDPLVSSKTMWCLE